MRFHFLFLALLPSLSLAASKYSCESVRFSDQIKGGIEFDSSRNRGHIFVEYWNGYPPITLVDAKFSGGPGSSGLLEYVSEADRYNGAVAKFALAPNALSKEEFLANLETSYRSPETGAIRVSKYEIKCHR